MSPAPDDPPILIYDRIDANRRKTRLLLVVFAVASTPVFLYAAHYLTAVIGILLVMPAASRAATSPSEMAMAPTLAVSASIAILLTVAVTYFVYRASAAMVLRLTRARPLEPEEEPDLSRVVENLCIGAGLPRPRLAVVESTATNLYSTGLDPAGATLVVTRGLLTALDRHELEGVVAQELSQIGNGDVRLGTVLATVVTLMWLPYTLAFGLLRALSRSNSLLGVGCLAMLLFFLSMVVFSIVIGGQLLFEIEMDPTTRLLFLLVGFVPIYAFVIGPGVGYLIRLAVTRKREFLADADAALLTRYPPGLACALTKIGAAGNAVLNTEASVAHLWIVNPRPRGRYPWSRIWSTHPPLSERIEILTRMGGTTPSMLQEAEADGIRYRNSVAGSTESGGTSGTTVEGK